MKRYEPAIDHAVEIIGDRHYSTATMRESEDGGWVSWADLAAERERLYRGWRRENTALTEIREKVRAERDVLREAMRTLSFFPLGDVVVDSTRKALAPLTPEQRSACGWPDPEAPKPMTWDEALSALKDGKRVRRRGEEYWVEGIRFNNVGELWRANGFPPCMTRDDFDATDWEVVT